jgi:hypothetical protein
MTIITYDDYTDDVYNNDDDYNNDKDYNGDKDDDLDDDDDLIISMNLYFMNIMIQLRNVDLHDDSITIFRQ